MIELGTEYPLNEEFAFEIGEKFGDTLIDSEDFKYDPQVETLSFVVEETIWDESEVLRKSWWRTRTRVPRKTKGKLSFLGVKEFIFDKYAHVETDLHALDKIPGGFRSPGMIPFVIKGDKIMFRLDPVEDPPETRHTIVTEFFGGFVRSASQDDVS